MPENQNIHDHTGLALHLRTIHFLLIAISAVIFVFSLSSSSNNLDKAFVEYRELHKFIHSEEWTPGLVKQICIDRVKKENLNFRAPNLYTSLRSGRNIKLWKEFNEQTYIWRLKPIKIQNYYCELRSTSNKEHASIIDKYSEVQGRFGYGMQERQKPESIEQFKLFWNELASGMAIHQFESTQLDKSIVINAGDLRKQYDPKIIIARSVKTMSSYTKSKRDRAHKYKRSLIVYRNTVTKLESEFGISNSLKANYLLMSKNLYDEDNVIVIPIYTKTKHYSALEAFMQRFNMDSTKLSISKFTKSFPHLSLLLSKSSEIKKLDQLELYLRESELNTSNSIDVFGIQMDVIELLLLGAIILTVLAVYFWLILRALVYKIDADDLAFSSPWLGLFPDFISFFLTITTCVLIPLAVAAWQYYKSFIVSNLHGQIVSSSLLLILIIASGLSLLAYSRLHRKALEFAHYMRVA